MARLDDEPILKLLAVGSTVAEVCDALGCTPNPVYARLRDPLFNARLHELRGQELRAVERFAHDRIALTLATLADIANGVNPATSQPYREASRIAAADALLRWASKLRADVDVAPRLAALEAALAEQGIDLPLAIREGGAE